MNITQLHTAVEQSYYESYGNSKDLKVIVKGIIANWKGVRNAKSPNHNRCWENKIR